MVLRVATALQSVWTLFVDVLIFRYGTYELDRPYRQAGRQEDESSTQITMMATMH